MKKDNILAKESVQEKSCNNYLEENGKIVNFGKSQSGISHTCTPTIGNIEIVDHLIYLILRAMT